MKRVECDKCEHFIWPKFKEVGTWESWTVKVKAKCELGKHVMFRSPISSINEAWGYPRYCNDFVKLSDVVSNI